MYDFYPSLQPTLTQPHQALNKQQRLALKLKVPENPCDVQQVHACMRIYTCTCRWTKLLMCIFIFTSQSSYICTYVGDGLLVDFSYSHRVYLSGQTMCTRSRIHRHAVALSLALSPSLSLSVCLSLSRSLCLAVILSLSLSLGLSLSLSLFPYVCLCVQPLF